MSLFLCRLFGARDYTRPHGTSQVNRKKSVIRQQQQKNDILKFKRNVTVFLSSVLKVHIFIIHVKRAQMHTGQSRGQLTFQLAY